MKSPKSLHRPNFLRSLKILGWAALLVFHPLSAAVSQNKELQSQFLSQNRTLRDNGSLATQSRGNTSSNHSVHTKHTLSPKLLGGNFENLQLRPIALIQSTYGSCTGTLVGTQIVLTAAHCLDGDVGPEDFTVRLAGESYGIVDGAFPAQYEMGAVSMQNSRYDIALLLLDRVVTNITPYPILTADAPAKKEKGTMYGYGLNENLPPEDLTTNGKSASAVIESLPDGVISTSLVSSQGAVCSGDSGGPLTQTIGDRIVVIGVTSTGTSVDDGPICLANGPTVSNFVNLQSSYALRFLREFSDVQFISGKTLRAIPLAKSAKTRLSSVAQLTTMSKVKSTLKSVTSLLERMKPLLGKSDLTVLRRVQSNVTKAANAKKVASAQSLSAAAIVALDRLSFEFD